VADILRHIVTSEMIKHVSGLLANLISWNQVCVLSATKQPLPYPDSVVIPTAEPRHCVVWARPKKGRVDSILLPRSLVKCQKAISLFAWSSYIVINSHLPAANLSSTVLYCSQRLAVLVADGTVDLNHCHHLFLHTRVCT
jgi:hypothetical protein